MRKSILKTKKRDYIKMNIGITLTKKTRIIDHLSKIKLSTSQKSSKKTNNML